MQTVQINLANLTSHKIAFCLCISLIRKKWAKQLRRDTTKGQRNRVTVGSATTVSISLRSIHTKRFRYGQRSVDGGAFDLLLRYYFSQRFIGWQYRLGTVNSKSFVGKVLLRIKWKFELTMFELTVPNLYSVSKTAPVWYMLYRSERRGSDNNSK